LLQVDPCLLRHKESFPVPNAAQSLGLDLPTYFEYYREFAELLEVPIAVMTYKDLAVRFGCQHAVRFCEQLVSEFRLRLEEFEELRNTVKVTDMESQDFIFAVFFTILKTLGIHTLEQDRSNIGVGSRKYSVHLKQIENFGEIFLKPMRETIKNKSNGKVPIEKLRERATNIVSKKKKKRYVTGINPMVTSIDKIDWEPLDSSDRYQRYIKWSEEILSDLGITT
jgi:hypothetical protein